MGRWLPERPAGRVVVVGAGKAAASMAAELTRHWRDLHGMVIVPYGHGVDCSGIEIVEAAHPVPDAAATTAAQEMLAQVTGLEECDTVVALVSGGGSSLLSLPTDGISLGEKQAITRQLLRSGAPIHEINCVRKKLSAVKGGRLAAAAAPAAVLTLLISDVPGNDAAMVASGPTIADDSAVSDALAILDRYDIECPPQVRRIVRDYRPVAIAESDLRILASSDDALIAASALALQHDVTPYSLGDVGGDARALAREHATLALAIADGQGPVAPPCVIISGGETTVEVSGDGRGGRNGEYALALALALREHTDIFAIACDTDGIDGNGDNAGCHVSPDSLARASAIGLDAAACLQNNDSCRLFEALGDLIVTGPTLTNVNDFRAILVVDETTQSPL